MKHLFKRLLLAAMVATLTFSSAAYAADGTTDTTTNVTAAQSSSEVTDLPSASEITSTVLPSNVTVKVRNGWYKTNGTWKYYSKGTLKFTSNAMHTAWNNIKSKSSGTSYYLVVDRKNFTVFAFKKSGSAWVPVRSMKCSVGRSSSPTPAGTWTIFSRWKILGFPNNSSWEFYPVEFAGKYHACFHSVLYYPMTKYKSNASTALKHVSEAKIKNGRLGAAISHGCVRLALANAKWIYTTCKNGTKVLVY